VSAAQLQAELSEVERDITLRKLLWESSDEWTKLEQEWKVCEETIQECNQDFDKGGA